jgi:hypothetical protein
VLFLAWFRVYNEAIAIQIKSIQAEEKHRRTQAYRHTRRVCVCVCVCVCIHTTIICTHAHSADCFLACL